MNSYNRFGKGEMLALFSAFCYGLSNVVQSWAMANTPLYAGTALKSLPVWIISIFAFAIEKRRNKKENLEYEKMSIDVVMLLMTMGILFYVLGNASIFAALKYGGVTISTPIMGTQVIWISILAYFLLGEKLNKKMLLGMIISIFGTLILTLERSSSNVYIENWKLAVLLSFITAICYAIGGIIQKILLTKRDLGTWTLLFYSLTFAQIILHILMIINGEINYYLQLNIMLFMKLILAGLVSSFAIISITKAMVYSPAALVSTINSLQTGIAPIFARILLKEELNLPMALGIALILSGVIIVQRNTLANFQ